MIITTLGLTFKRWGKAIVNDSHGLERGCDLVPHINTPLRLSISFVFSMNSKHKIPKSQNQNSLVQTFSFTEYIASN